MLLLGPERCQVTPTGQWEHWRGGQRELWAGKEGGKVRGFPVQLHFSLSLSPSGEKSLGENDESSVKQDTKNTHGAARAGTARPCLKHGERERGDKDKKMLDLAPASTKEPRPGPSACQRQRGRARGCHQPSRVTSGGWGREVTATTSHRGETFPSARAALVTKEREQGTACSGWDGGGVTQAVTRVPWAVTRVPKPRQSGRDGSCSPQTASQNAPEAGSGVGHKSQLPRSSSTPPWSSAAPGEAAPNLS